MSILKSGIGALAALFGIGGPTSAFPLPSVPNSIYRSSTHGVRSRTPGPRRPAGAKLARLAYERRVGLSTIR